MWAWEVRFLSGVLATYELEKAEDAPLGVTAEVRMTVSFLERKFNLEFSFHPQKRSE